MTRLICCVPALLAAVALQTLAAEPAPVQPARPKIGLVLAGGGAKGVAHIGVLKVLEELRVPVDYIVGTSMGSIVAGSYASGLSAARMEKILKDTDFNRVLTDRLPRPDRALRSKELERANIYGIELGVDKSGFKLPAGALYGQNVEAFLSELAGPVDDVGSFDDLPTPYRAVATDIVTGAMVVIDRGDLVGAMRASMAVPGVFSPVELDNRLLVDGGLARNLPVDVARKMGAEVIIAVNLETTPVTRADITSVLSVTVQMVDLLIEQNVRQSLSELTPRDILITPQLGTYSSANFADSVTLIPVGEAAARQMTDRLRALALSPDQYRAFRKPQLARERPDVPVSRVRLDDSQLAFVNPQSVEAQVQPGPVEGVTREVLQDKVDALLATDDFQQVRYRFVENEHGQRELVLEPVAKGWGPNYLRFGLDLSADFNGNSAFTLLFDYRMTWLNRLGLEWRNTLSIGQVTGIYSELYQPLDLRRRFFVAPYVSWVQQNDALFIDEDAFASYRTREANLGLDLGAHVLGQAGEVRLGYEWGRTSGTLRIGDPLFPDYQQTYGAVRLRALFDTLDNWAFPSRGVFASAELKVARQGLGGDLDFDLAEIALDKPFALGARNRLVVGLRWGDSLGTQLPFSELLPLGGFLNLSGFQPRQFLSEGFTFGRLVYYRRLNAPSGFAATPLYLGVSLEGAYIKDRVNGADDNNTFTPAGSLFIAADTLLGPLYFAVGAGGGSNYALYLFLGRP